MQTKTVTAACRVCDISRVFACCGPAYRRTVASRTRPRAVREWREACGVIIDERHLRDAAVPYLSGRSGSIKDILLENFFR